MVANLAQFSSYQPRILPPRYVTLPSDGLPVSHASAHARLHTQALRTEQLKPFLHSVSHGPVTHGTSPPMKRPDRLHLPTSSRCGAFRLQSLGGAESIAGAMNWLWRGYLAPGQLTLLTSLWKSGKTTLLSILRSRLKDGGRIARPTGPAFRHHTHCSSRNAEARTGPPALLDFWVKK